MRTHVQNVVSVDTITDINLIGIFFIKSSCWFPVYSYFTVTYQLHISARKCLAKWIISQIEWIFLNRDMCTILRNISIQHFLVFLLCSFEHHGFVIINGHYKVKGNITMALLMVKKFMTKYLMFLANDCVLLHIYLCLSNAWCPCQQYPLLLTWFNFNLSLNK